MVNKYARLEKPFDHDLALKLVTAPDRAAFYTSYEYDVSPPTDDHPFFFHFFRWEQTPQVIENLGRRWQPFGGSGYLVLIALLAFVLVATVLFVIVPIALRAHFRQVLRRAGTGRSIRTLGHFAGIGLAYLLVEVALIQRFILVLTHPTVAMATVIGSLLLFSGVGSLVSHRLSGRYVLLLLAFLLAIYPWFTGLFTPLLLPIPLILRAIATMLLIAPVGFLMGVPFARGINALRDVSALIPWAWAVNGSASVISAVLATILSLSLGFTPVLFVGGGLYLLNAVLFRANE
jgi:hypothetical protein